MKNDEMVKVAVEPIGSHSYQVEVSAGLDEMLSQKAKEQNKPKHDIIAMAILLGLGEIKPESTNGNN